MKLQKKHIILLVLVVAAYFLLFKKKNTTQTPEEALEATKQKANAKYASGQEENVQVAETDKATEEYNMLRQEHYNLSGGYYPPSSYSAKQIQNAIDEMKAKNEALDKYVQITGSVATDEMEDMTLAELERQAAAAEKQAAAAEKQAQKKSWTTRKAQIDQDITDLKYTLNGPKYNTPLNVTPISKMAGYKDAELCYAVNKFGSAPVVKPFSGGVRRTRPFFDAIGKQGSADTHNKERGGTSSFYSYAKQIIARRSRVEGKTVDEYGVMH